MGRRKDSENRQTGDHMTDEQKIEFLYGWCHRLEATLEGRRKVIYRKGKKKRGPNLRSEKVK
jgi:hypothetical protein